MFKLLLILFINSILVNTVISASGEYIIEGINDAAICVAAGFVSPYVGIACSAYTAAKGFLFNENRIKGILIEPGKCIDVKICPNKQYEICSDKPNRLYGVDHSNMSVLACYNWGNPGTTFRQCCRIDHHGNGFPVESCTTKRFCAGPAKGVTTALDINSKWQKNKHCIKHQLEYYECIGWNHTHQYYCDNAKVLYKDSCSSWYSN